MGSFWNFLFAAILVIIWIVAGGYITQANVKLGPSKNTDSNLHNAYWYSFWAAFITWFLIGAFLLLVIIAAVFGIGGVFVLFGSGAGEVATAGVAEGAEGAAAEGVAAEGAEGEGAFSQYAKTIDVKKTASTAANIITIVSLIIALILVTITGVLSAATATNISRSSNFDPSNTNMSKAYTDSIVAASLCLGAAGLLIIGIIVYIVVSVQRKNKIKQQQALMEN